MQLELDLLGFNPLNEAKKATKLHRFEQQLLFNFCIEFIKQCAEDGYEFDNRNYDAHHRAVDIVATCKL